MLERVEFWASLLAQMVNRLSAMKNLPSTILVMFLRGVI